MGHRTYTDVVPFVAHSLVYGDEFSEMPAYTRIFDPDWYNDEADEPVSELHGWQLGPYVADEYLGKRGHLCPGRPWVKDDMKVFTINEHQWSNGGGWDMSLVADSAEAIKAFYEEVIKADLPDVELPEILADDAVQQSL